MEPMSFLYRSTRIYRHLNQLISLFKGTTAVTMIQHSLAFLTFSFLQWDYQLSLSFSLSLYRQEDSEGGCTAVWIVVRHQQKPRDRVSICCFKWFRDPQLTINIFPSKSPPIWCRRRLLRPNKKSFSFHFFLSSREGLLFVSWWCSGDLFTVAASTHRTVSTGGFSTSCWQFTMFWLLE